MNVCKKIEGRLNRLIDELNRATESAEFEDEDVFRFVRDAATLWERTLKRCTLSNHPSDPSLYHLINALELNGVDTERRDALHELRKAANKGKHESDSTMTTAGARNLIQSTIPALVQLESAGISELAAAADFNQRRRYIIDLFDRYTTGDTEFAVYLLGGVPGVDSILAPKQIEVFDVKYNTEDAIKTRLAETGHADFVNGGAGLTRPYGDDFAGRWEWEGTHRDLVAAFAPHQWNADLITGLSRADHFPSVISAAALAMVDVARPAQWKDLLWKMSADFGIWRRGTVVEKIARAAVALSGEQIEHIYYGPRWLTRSDVLSSVPPDRRFEGDGFVLGIDEHQVVLVGLDLGLRGLAIFFPSDDDLRRPNDPLEAV
ncbi:CHAD domain-containing protein [Pseudomonas fluorescens]|uniref:CHAD domain-containing protein n=1 Tax=Pseudomonas fluorescens TaxID=294 RepID=UPI00125A31FF|nr:CHAD domain-containing protein [Pseudomonas fluorescens]VVO74249.1 hypothetical protein PS843_01440 [Pseudomonas fluorescens]